jgi:hypothetical protein
MSGFFFYCVLSPWWWGFVICVQYWIYLSPPPWTTPFRNSDFKRTQEIFTSVSSSRSAKNAFKLYLPCRLRLKCDGTRAETRFRLSAKRTSPFKSAGASVQATTGSRGVHISGSNAGYTMFRGSVKSTGYLLHSTVSPSIPPFVRHRVPSRFNWTLSGAGACRWSAIQIYCRAKECLKLNSVLSHAIMACTRTTVLYFLAFRFVLMLVSLRTVTVGVQSESISWKVCFLHYRYNDAL